MLVSLDDVLFFGRKNSRNVKTSKIVVRHWWRAFYLSFYFATSWLIKVGRKSYPVNFDEVCHFNFSKVSGPAAAISCCGPHGVV